MEKIKVFLGMEFGRLDGYEMGVVIATLANGYKVIGIDYSDLRGDGDDDTTWVQVVTAKPYAHFGWYATDGLDLDIDDKGMIEVKR